MSYREGFEVTFNQYDFESSTSDRLSTELIVLKGKPIENLPTASAKRNLYLNKISSVKFLDFNWIETQQIKGCEYYVYMNSKQTPKDISTRKTIRFTYFKMPNVDTRLELKKTLKNLRSANPEGLDRIYRNHLVDFNHDIDNKRARKIGNLELLKKYGFIIEFDSYDNALDAMLVEGIITMLSEMKEFKENDLQVVEGEIIDDKLLCSMIMLLRADVFNTVGEYFSSNSNQGEVGHEYDLVNGNCLLLVPDCEEGFFNVLDKNPPLYEDVYGQFSE